MMHSEFGNGWEPGGSLGIGHMSAHRDWGMVAKCPHCDATNVQRKAKRQITCGAYSCQQKQNNVKHLKRARA